MVVSARASGRRRAPWDAGLIISSRTNRSAAAAASHAALPTRRVPSPPHSHRAAAETRARRSSQSLVSASLFISALLAAVMWPAATSVARVTSEPPSRRSLACRGLTSAPERNFWTFYRRGGDRVGENQVGEELALRAGTRGARGKRVDRVQEAIRDVAPRDAVAVRERREPSPETRQFARHLLREQSTNARRHLLGYRRARHELGRSHVILEVRVLVHEARQHVRHVPQRGGGRHAEATMPPTKIRRRLF